MFTILSILKSSENLMSVLQTFIWVINEDVEKYWT